MSTKSKAQRKLVEKQKIEKSMSPTEKKIKDFIQDMIEYYKTQKKKEDKKEAKAFTYNILAKRDLMVNNKIDNNRFSKCWKNKFTFKICNR